MQIKTDVQIQIGCDYIELGLFEQAVYVLNKAIALDPKRAEAYNLRGFAYGEMGEYDASIEDSNSAILQ
jgi:lipoprotein NlpI